MSTSQTPERIREFFESKIDSVELIHVLMLLHDRPGEPWTITSISNELRSSESSVSKRVSALIGRGIFARDAFEGSVVKYIPIDAAMNDVIALSIAFYRANPDRVVGLIFSRKTGAIQSIAEAFRFRKDE